ncbi:Gamma-tubulin complex component 5 [Branchiostoma belcheri]|nr:Gamma-tubulin complex component 5 [Branchiostoma belcheri]
MYNNSSNLLRFNHSSETLLFGNSSDPLLFNNSSDPLLFNNSSDPLLFGNSSDPLLFGNSSDPLLFNNSSDPLLFNNSSDPLLFGNSSDPLLFNNSSETLLFNNSSDPLLFNNSSDPLLFNNSSDPLLFGNSSDPLLFNNSSDPLLFNNSSDPLLFNNSSDPLLFGNSSDPLLFGNSSDPLRRQKTRPRQFRGGGTRLAEANQGRAGGREGRDAQEEAQRKLDSSARKARTVMILVTLAFVFWLLGFTALPLGLVCIRNRDVCSPAAFTSGMIFMMVLNSALNPLANIIRMADLRNEIWQQLTGPYRGCVNCLQRFGQEQTGQGENGPGDGQNNVIGLNVLQPTEEDREHSSAGN